MQRFKVMTDTFSAYDAAGHMNYCVGSLCFRKFPSE